MTQKDIDKITDLTILADMLIKTEDIKPNPNYRDWCDTDKKNKSNSIAFTVMKRINDHDQNILANVAIKAKRMFIQDKAVEMLNDQEILSDVVRKSTHFGVIFDAIEKLTDQTVQQTILTDVSNNKKLCGYTRRNAAEKLKDRILARDVLYEIFNDCAKEVGEQIIHDTEDTELLNMIIKGTPKLHVVKTEHHKYDHRTGEYLGTDGFSTKQIDLRDVARRKLIELQGK